jgi:hypothetical protein
VASTVLVALGWPDVSVRGDALSIGRDADVTSLRARVPRTPAACFVIVVDTISRGHSQCSADGIAVPPPCLNTKRPSTDTAERIRRELKNRADKCPYWGRGKGRSPRPGSVKVLRPVASFRAKNHRRS